jgi:CBS domain-containing protein
VGKVSDLNSRAIEEFMTPDPTALHPGDPIKHALHFMAVNDFMYIPLVDAEGRPQDLLSFRRIARLIDQMD